MAGRHRAQTGRYIGGHRKPKSTKSGYKAKHRDSLFSRLAGRPTAAQVLNNSRQKPGVFPGIGDIFGPVKAVGRARPKGKGGVSLWDWGT